MIYTDAKKIRETVLSDLGDYINMLGDKHLRYLYDLVLDQFEDTDKRILVEMVRGDVKNIPNDPQGHYVVVYDQERGKYSLVHGDLVGLAPMTTYCILPPDYTYQEDC